MKQLSLLILATMLLALYSFIQPDQSTDWEVPDSAKKMKNPTDVLDKENIALGKSFFSKYCQSCHGKEGYGDGPKAKELKGDMGDFSSEEFQTQSDGTLFYKMTKGRGDMPSFEKKIVDPEDRWLIVNYLRMLKE
ncbi:MAG: cytochrome C [Flammeovirgaceae bacterium]|nr:cytochrome C [Flammeovirgaceae bacterium]MBR07707.1 cytochrome C [Rickettsiales bacterium]|tara:strand:- start:36 stop:440 length:405 start_codon:yes stop_codon:yes gene_type:complete